MTAATPSTPVSSAVRSWGRARTTIEPSASARAAPAAIATEAARPPGEVTRSVTSSVTPYCRYRATRRLLTLLRAALPVGPPRRRPRDLLGPLAVVDRDVVAVARADVDLARTGDLLLRVVV